MSYRPHNLALQMDDYEGEDFMSHKPPTDAPADNNKPDKPRVVSVAPARDNQLAQDKPNRFSQINTGVLDKKLRVAETSLQKPEDISNNFAEGLGASIGNVDKIRDILFGGQMRDLTA